MEEEKQEENALTLIEKANVVAARIEEANKKTEELLMRQEEIRTKELLGGKAEVGQQPEKPKEETDEDYAKRLISKPYGDVKVETPE